MRKHTTTLIIIGLVILLAILIIALILTYSKGNAISKKIWNNGIHDGCGGRWHIVARHYDYVYECDTCYASFVSSNNYSQIK